MTSSPPTGPQEPDPPDVLLFARAVRDLLGDVSREPIPPDLALRVSALRSVARRIISLREGDAT